MKPILINKINNIKKLLLNKEKKATYLILLIVI